MKILVDFQGRPVRLTDERRQHILEHPEMAGMESALAETLRDPQLVIGSRNAEMGSLPFFRGLLVALFFMHVLYSSKLTWIAIAGGLFWLGILLSFTLMDYLTRHWLAY
jgi:hypothetical protein